MKKQLTYCEVNTFGGLIGDLERLFRVYLSGLQFYPAFQGFNPLRYRKKLKISSAVEF